MTVQDGPDEIKQAALRKDYPVEEGLTAGTTTQEGRQINLVAEEGSNVVRKGRRGFQ